MQEEIKISNRTFEKIIRFYSDCALNLPNAINILSELQRDSPEVYQVLKEDNENPLRIMEILPFDERRRREALILTIFYGKNLLEKASKVWEMGVDEQIKLVKELDEFKERTEERIKSLEKVD
jgi:hypothetical protein